MKHVMVAGSANARILAELRDRGLDRRIRVLAQGDSWFAFPLPVIGMPRNLVEAIETRKATVAINLSIVGDTAENMAQGDRFAQLRAILCGTGDEEPIEIAAILLSAGGNDLIDRIADLVGTVTRGLKGIAREEAHRRVMRELASGAATAIYDDVIAHIRLLIEARGSGPSARAPVIVHGYAHVTPRDAPALRFPIKVGPWIWKKLSPLGYTQPEQQEIAARVIDEFNRRLATLHDESKGIYVLDLRTLQAAGGPLPVADPKWLEPTAYWHDEIHLDAAGWDCVAATLYAPLLDRLL